jgi:hypothetical protein
VLNNESVDITSVVAGKESLKPRWVLDNPRLRIHEALVSDIDLIFGSCDI